MRLALVYDAVHPWVTGGGERRFHELAVRLAESGHDVHWYGMRWWDGPAVLVRDGITYHGVCRVRPLYTASGRRSIWSALVFGLATLRLLGSRYDVVDCCGFPFFSLFSARLATWVRGGALVSTWHEVWGPAYWREYLGRLGVVGALVERSAAALPDTVVVVSEVTAARMAPLRPGARGRSVHLVTAGLDHAEIAAAPAAGSGFDLLYAGRLTDAKDVELLLAAHALVVAQRPGTTCGIVGEGPHRGVLEAFADELGTGLVTFTGRLETALDVYGVMKASSVFALTSTREGFGIVVIEAHACGLPAVVAAHPDNAATSLVGEGYGLVAEPTPRSVADAALELLHADAEARAAASALAVASSREFDWDRVAQRYADTLEAAR